MKLTMTLVTMEAPRRQLISADCVTCLPGQFTAVDDAGVAEHLTGRPGHVIVSTKQVTEMSMIGVQAGGGHVEVDVPTASGEAAE